MFFMNFQLIAPVLLTPTNYCFHDQVIPPPDKLEVVYQTNLILFCDHRQLPQSY